MRRTKVFLIILVALLIVFGFGCGREESVTITIVDIGHLDRIGIAKELSIINKYSPKVIGLDFLLTTDSLDKDVTLSEELASTKNMIQATKLHNNDPFDITRWDSLEQYHQKFGFGDQGFSNMTVTDDSVIVRELPMRQYFREDIELAFSYLVAIKYDFDKVDDDYKSGINDFAFDKNVFGSYFKVISVKDLLTENFNKRDLTGKIVLMGHVGDKEDSFYLDNSRTERISVVEFHACIVRELLD